MRFSRMINVVGVHAAGELNEVITGGVRDVPGRTVFEKMRHLETKDDWLRQFLLQEPRGRITQCVNLVVPATDPSADIGFVIIESDYYVPMSGTNTICTVTALLETGMLPMREPVTNLVLEAPAGLVSVSAECRNGKCVSVTFENLPAFVFGLDKGVEVQGLGTIMVDVAYGGMIYALVDAPSLGFELVSSEGADLVAVGERIKAAAAEQVPASHPENPEIHTINQVLFAGPLGDVNGERRARNAVVVSPGRLDRSPCGTGTCARLAVMHARGQIAAGQRFVHESILGTEFVGTVLGTASAGAEPAIRPAITGSGWITAFHQYVLDPTDPFPNGFRLGDTWPGEAAKATNKKKAA
ncbi:MAG: proline racemase family protein [Hyphomicrobiales bacterium]|nr:proline racemase family protein [Hyphomicrobiales bacterium]